MSRRAGLLAASLVLEHVPDLVRFGSKPLREQDRAEALAAARRGFDDVLAYPPHQVFIGNGEPESLWQLDRPWWKASSSGKPEGPFGEIIDQTAYFGLLAEADEFDLVGAGEEPKDGDLPLIDDGRLFGRLRSAHDSDESLSATVLLENLAAKATGAHAVRHLLAHNAIDPESIDYVLGAGEEAIGDRYQRGGGSLAKAIAAHAGLTSATGADLKAFCAAPIHALATAGALVESSLFDRVLVTAGGSLAKLGMKFLGALKAGAPVLEDVLAGMAILVGVAEAGTPIIRLDAVGRHRVGSGSSQEALLTDLVAAPLKAMGRGFEDIDRYATELHDAEITIPAGGGDVPLRNYQLIAGLGRLAGELDQEAASTFPRRRGLPGFAPTQGHIASAVPWVPHALERMAGGSLTTTMLLATGSLFLGRMTRMWDGVSVTLEV